MTTTKELLNTFNTAAAASGKATLKAWKGTKEALQTRIDAILSEDDALAPAGTPTTPKKATPTKKATTKKATKAPTNTTTVVEIAASLKINPKVARAKLRRRGMSATEGRWSVVKIDSKDHKKIVEILKNGRKSN